MRLPVQKENKRRKRKDKIIQSIIFLRVSGHEMQTLMRSEVARFIISQLLDSCRLLHLGNKLLLNSC